MCLPLCAFIPQLHFEVYTLVVHLLCATPRRRQVLLTSDHWICSFYCSEYSQVLFFSSKISPSTILSGQLLHNLTKPIWSSTSFGKPLRTVILFIYIFKSVLMPTPCHVSSWVRTRSPSCCRYLFTTFEPLIHACHYLYHMQLLQLFITFSETYLFVDFTHYIEAHVLSNVCKCAILKLLLFLFSPTTVYLWSSYVFLTLRNLCI